MNSNITYAVQNSQLARYIKHYYVLDFSGLDNEGVEVKVPPTGFPVLQFHFGSQANYYRHKHFTCQSLFIGQCSRHVMLFPTKGMKLLGVNFKPYGLYNLFGISPRNILNSGVESSAFFGMDSVNEISETLKNQGIEKGIAELEKLLISHQNNSVKKQPFFDEIVDRIELKNGLIDYSELINKSVSVRTIQRYFREVIGISPKLFCQVLRHKFILGLLYKNPEINWSDLQLNGFYYDFAHFSKDFTNFSGLTPRQYLPIRNSFAATLLKQS
ncbi:MAG: DUF6597 domain-containing transcriptional factor [Bacteroidales bacterium]